MKHHHGSRLVTTALAIAFMSCTLSAFAEDKTEAKRHFEAGLQLLRSEEFAAAAVEFEESLRLYETKSALVNLASCFKALRRYNEALATIATLKQRFGDSLDEELRLAAEELRNGILASTGTLAVEVNAPGAAVLVDGVQVGTSPLPGPVRLAPGEHELEVTLDGREAQQETVRLLSGQELKRALSFSPAVQARPLTERPTAPEPTPGLAEPSSKSDAARSTPLLVASLGSTAVTVALGVVAGVLWSAAIGKRDDYEAANTAYTSQEPGSLTAEAENAAYTKLENQHEEAKQKNGAAVGLTIGAGALVAVSAVLWVAFGRSGAGEQQTVTLGATPGGLSLTF